MQKFKNKIIVFLVIFIIISSGITAVSAIDINNKCITSEKENSEVTLETVTLFRYGLDGSVKTIEIEIEVDDETDIYDLIEKKCEKLLEEDNEFQELLDNTSSTNLFSKVRSRGRGIHLKIAPQLIWPVKFKLFPLLPPYIFRRVKIPIIYCRYPRDPDAFTEVDPIISGAAEKTTSYHSVLSIGFYGFKWWLGSVSFLGFIFRTGFVGFSLFTRTRKI